MKMDKLKGRFLVVDGSDGAGKSTQVKLLGDFISGCGVEAVLCRDPGGTRIGEQIRSVLLDKAYTEMSVRCETLLYMASRAQLYDEVILPALERDCCVVCDRWISSTYAYQAEAGRLGSEQLIRIVEASLARSWPDLTIIIDFPAGAALARVGLSPDRMEAKGEAFHHRVREGFLSLARGRSDFSVVDGQGAIDDVHERIRKVVARYVGL